jgi:hypothetical protein
MVTAQRPTAPTAESWPPEDTGRVVPSRPRASVALLAIGVAALAASGCYGNTTPSYNPGDITALVQSVTRHGLAISATVSGDSPCNDPTLINNALHLTVADPASGSPRDVYVYAFREKNWVATRDAWVACADAYASAHPTETVTRLEIPVYRAFGAGWSEDLRDAVNAALTDASESGTGE